MAYQNRARREKQIIFYPTKWLDPPYGLTVLFNAKENGCPVSVCATFTDRKRVSLGTPIKMIGIVDKNSLTRF